MLDRRLREVAEFRSKHAHKHLPYAQWPERPEDGDDRDLITLDEAITLRDAHGYPNDIIEGLFTGGGQPQPARYFSAVSMVVGCGDIEAAKYLIEQGLSFNVYDDLQMMPIEVAARLGRVEMVRFLLLSTDATDANDISLDNLLSDLVRTLDGDACVHIIQSLCNAFGSYDYIRLARGALRAGQCEIMSFALGHYELEIFNAVKAQEFETFEKPIVSALYDRFPHLAVMVTQPE